MLRASPVAPTPAPAWTLKDVNGADVKSDQFKGKVVVLDFWATWCGPCKAIGPTVDAVAAKYAGQLKVTKVNVDQNGATPSRYGIRGIPALLLFKGGKVVDQIVGYVPQDVIEEKVQRLVAPAGAVQSVSAVQ